MSITSVAAEVFRNDVTPGNPLSGKHKPDKGAIRDLFAQVESEMVSAVDFDSRAGYATSASFGLVGDGVADDTAAMQAFFDNSFGRGYLAPGTYKCSPLTMPGEVEIWGGPFAIIKGATATGVLITLTGSDITLRGFTVDGIALLDTVAGGYIAGHYGIQSEYGGDLDLGTSFGILAQRITIDGLTVKNFGHSAIDLRKVDDSLVAHCNVSRCGYGGIMFWSGLRCDVKYNTVTNIFPGDDGITPKLNAYGVVFSNWTLDRVSVECRGLYNKVYDIPSWEGMDEHNGEGIEFIGNTIKRCATGIAFQHSTAGQPLLDCKALGNTIVGWAGTFTRENDYTLEGGIIAIGAPIAGGQGTGLTLNDNSFIQHGDSRTGGFAGTSGAIKVQNMQNFTINDNRFYNCMCQAIYLETGIDGVGDSCIGFQITGNIISVLNTINSIKRAIRTTGRCLGQVSGNYAVDAGLTNAFTQSGSPTNVTTFANNTSV